MAGLDDSTTSSCSASATAGWAARGDFVWKHERELGVEGTTDLVERLFARGLPNCGRHRVPLPNKRTAIWAPLEIAMVYAPTVQCQQLAVYVL